MKRMLQNTLFALPVLSLAVWALALFVFPLRTSLILNGRPFAKVVPKSEVNIFQYTETDSLRAYAIVFSWGKAVGYVEQPLGFPVPYYVPLGEPPSVCRDNDEGFFYIALYGGWLCCSILAILVEAVIIAFVVIRRKVSTQAPKSTS
jgi:hypothetical protein